MSGCSQHAQCAKAEHKRAVWSWGSLDTLAAVSQGMRTASWTAFYSSCQHDASESPRSRSKEGPETQRHKGDKSVRWAERVASKTGEMHSGSCTGAESWGAVMGRPAWPTRGLADSRAFSIKRRLLAQSSWGARWHASLAVLVAAGHTGLPAQHWQRLMSLCSDICKMAEKYQEG